MAISYTVIVKELCAKCVQIKNNKKRIEHNCTSCAFVKYHNVTKLLNLTTWLDCNKPNWVWFKVYSTSTKEELVTYRNWYNEYTQDANGRYIYVGKKRDVPSNQIL